MNLYDGIGEGPTEVDLEQLDKINKRERIRAAFDLLMEEEEEAEKENYDEKNR